MQYKKLYGIVQMYQIKEEDKMSFDLRPVGTEKGVCIPPVSNSKMVVPAAVLPGVDPAVSIHGLGNFKKAKIYGMLLVPDPNHPMAEVIRDYWSAIHRMTGDKILLVLFQKPDEWPRDYKEEMEEIFGENFDDYWSEWQKKEESALAYKYMTLFEPALKINQLPCIVFFTDLIDRKAIIRPIPNANKDVLYDFLQTTIESALECIENNNEDEDIFTCLKENIDSPSAEILAKLKSNGQEIVDLIKKNPKIVVKISIVVLTAAVPVFGLPAGAAAVVLAILQVVAN